MFDTKEKLVTFCLSPFSKISISSGLRSVTILPFLSVTVTSNWISAVVILTTSVSSAGGGVAGRRAVCEYAAHTDAAVMNKIAASLFMAKIEANRELLTLVI